LRNIAAALAVALLHVAAIRVLLIVRSLLVPSAGEEPAPAMTWVYLPAEPGLATASNPAASASTGDFVMSPLITGETGIGGAVAVPISLLPPPSPPAVALPPLAPLAKPDAHALAAIGNYLACDFANYDKFDDEQRNRCALNLSHLGSVLPLPPDYVDGKSTPFSLFGAEGTFAITPPAQSPFDLLASSTGCAWEGGLCRMRQLDKFGLDPDDQKRLTAAAHFDLGKGFSLDAGAQGFMQNDLLGAHFVLTSGVVLTYRW